MCKQVCIKGKQRTVEYFLYPHKATSTFSYTLAPAAVSVLCECFSLSLNTHLFEAEIIINNYVCLLSNTENPKECVEKTGSVA